jgi:hypothetical protein
MIRRPLTSCPVKAKRSVLPFSGVGIVDVRVATIWQLPEVQREAGTGAPPPNPAPSWESSCRNR